jgi:hypothetical protein
LQLLISLRLGLNWRRTDIRSCHGNWAAATLGRLDQSNLLNRSEEIAVAIITGPSAEEQLTRFAAESI